MSTIPFPVTQNYIYQSLLTTLSANKEILQNGVTPTTEVFLQYENRTFEILRNNGYKYNFVYNLDLNDFLNPSDIQRTEVISHDQITKNFDTPLVYFGGFQYLYRRVEPSPFRQGYIQQLRRSIYHTATIGYLYNLPPVHSKQYPNGITLTSYMQSVIDQLPVIIRHCPDLTNVQEYHPLSYVHEYTYTDLLGQVTTKTASFTAMKYTHNGNKKVLFFGTGLQEFVVN